MVETGVEIRGDTMDANARRVAAAMVNVSDVLFAVKRTCISEDEH